MSNKNKFSFATALAFHYLCHKIKKRDELPLCSLSHLAKTTEPSGIHTAQYRNNT